MKRRRWVRDPKAIDTVIALNAMQPGDELIVVNDPEFFRRDHENMGRGKRRVLRGERQSGRSALHIWNIGRWSIIRENILAWRPA